MDRHGNVVAREGLTFCWCGCKYWENDICHSCGEPVKKSLDNPLNAE